MNYTYFLWVPLTLVYNFIVCWIAVKYNQVSFMKGYIYLILFSFIPTWSLCSYYSKNLIFDGMLFNLIVIISSPIFMIMLGQNKNFTWINYVGIVVTIVGLYLIKR